MLENLAAACRRVHICIRIRDLAVSHKLEQRLRVGMCENTASWKREDGFHRSEIIAERHQTTLKRLYENGDPEPFQVRVHFNTRRLPTPQEIPVDMKAEVTG